MPGWNQMAPGLSYIGIELSREFLKAKCTRFASLWYFALGLFLLYVIVVKPVETTVLQYWAKQIRLNWIELSAVEKEKEEVPPCLCDHHRVNARSRTYVVECTSNVRCVRSLTVKTSSPHFWVVRRRKTKGNETLHDRWRKSLLNKLKCTK